MILETVAGQTTAYEGEEFDAAVLCVTIRAGLC